MGGLLRGWTLKIDLRAWTRSFRFKYAAGSNDADKSKDNNSSYVNLKDLNPNVMPEIHSKTSTTVTRDPDSRLAEVDFPVEGIVVSNTFGRESDMIWGLYLAHVRRTWSWKSWRSGDSDNRQQRQGSSNHHWIYSVYWYGKVPVFRVKWVGFAGGLQFGGAQLTPGSKLGEEGLPPGSRL